MFNPVTFLGNLAFDALYKISGQAAERLRDNARPRSEANLDEIAEHLGAIRALLEDTRNLLQHSPTPDPRAAALAAVNAAIAQAGRDAGSSYAEMSQAFAARSSDLPVAAQTGEGVTTVTSKCLRVAAGGLDAWASGLPCTGPTYWREIAKAVRNVARAQDAVDTTK